MAAQGFAFEDCLLKHYVRVKGWLPHCTERRKKANEGVAASKHRRVRYFTFCAVGAIDVLMLDIAKVIRLSQEGKFDTVVFFDKSSDAVLETQKRIPGSIGFPGNFTEVVLANDPDANITEQPDPLASPTNQQNTDETRRAQLVHSQRQLFIKQFPFDIVNLDLEEFAFKPNDPFPGKVVNALRKVLLWQKNPLYAWPRQPQRSITLDGFTLMFTTQIGPPNISTEYADMLGDCLTRNVNQKPELSQILQERMGVADVPTLKDNQFAQFFKLGLPKLLAELVLEADWYIDPDNGIKTFEFSRHSATGEYRMLHLVMDVKRQAPPLLRRAPNTGHTAAASEAYDRVVERIFQQPEIAVTDQLATAANLKPTLADIQARRKRYLGDTD
jgi:hypothetical protein